MSLPLEPGFAQAAFEGDGLATGDRVATDNLKEVEVSEFTFLGPMARLRSGRRSWTRCNDPAGAKCLADAIARSGHRGPLLDRPGRVADSIIAGQQLADLDQS